MINLTTLSPVEIIASILIVFSMIKILVIIIKPQSWMNLGKKVWTNPIITAIVSLILAIIVLYYLLQEITIVQILATTAFIGLLIVVGLARQGKNLIKIYEGQIKTKTFWKIDTWLYTLLWLALILWGAKELLI